MTIAELTLALNMESDRSASWYKTHKYKIYVYEIEGEYSDPLYTLEFPSWDISYDELADVVYQRNKNMEWTCTCEEEHIRERCSGECDCCYHLHTEKVLN